MARRGKTMIMPRASRRKAATGAAGKEDGPHPANSVNSAKSPGIRRRDTIIRISAAKSNRSRGSPQQEANRTAKTKQMAEARPPREAAAKSASPVKPSRGKHVLSSPASALSESSPSAKAALARKKSPPSPRTKSKLNAKTKTKAKTQTLRPTTLVPTTSPSPSPSHSSTTTSFATPVQPRKRHLQSTLAADLAKSSTQTPSDVIEELRQKFQQLNMLRTTAAEALLEDYKKTSEERIMAAERVIDSLRRENEALKTRLEEHTGSTNGNLAAPRTPSRLSDASTLTVERTDLFRPLLELYESLSGLRVTTDLDQERLWHCSLGGRQGEFAFDLAFDEQEGQYRYTPKFPPKSPIASRLPGYLQDEIAFDPDQLQLFFWRALNFLMSVPK